MDMSQYLQIFIEEAKEHVQSLNECLLQIEKDPEGKDVLNEIFRVAHTLKGMAGTMGYTKMTKLTHVMENVLHAIRNDEINITSDLVDVLFKCLDALENYVKSVVNTGGEGDKDYKNVIDDLNQILNNKGTVKTPEKTRGTETPEQLVNDSKYITAQLQPDEFEKNAVNKAIDMGINALKITLVLNSGCLLKSARAFILFQTLERYGEIIKSQPSVQDIEDEKFDYEFTVIVVSKENEQLFNKELNSIAEVDEVVITTLQKFDTTESSTDADENKHVSEAETIETVQKTSKQTVESQDAAKTNANNAPRKTQRTVRVDIDRLDVLMNLVGELIITKTRLEGTDIIEKPQEYHENLEYLERITTNLNDAVMKVRMVPVETVFNRFPRMIRDIAKDLGKEIELKMSGEETELDRTVIDEIGDPLIHLLRNSCDHGLESTEKRKEIGKPEVGRINLTAYQSGNNVLIEVEDDGAGINIEKIKNKAVDNGIITREAANSMTQQDAIELLFRPSFSTAEKITGLSGRGVGLDVVKTKIEQLGGTVEVETQKGKGSKFIIKLPLTLAIYQALLVNVGGEKYAIPLGAIYQIYNWSAEDVKTVQGQEVILLRNMVVPITRLADALEVPNSDEANQKQLKIVIVRKGEKLTGLVVDSVIGQQEIVIKSLGKLLTGIKYLAGATILGDGNVALIIDVNSIT
ncbi:chemotaxis protein CheA [Ruminiclostridium cellulolyticum]|uniref:Chemotaxis protein CheA n=1 Tax=Ruminiclostridium cellulolyticum (strain ATCC 35319 / DSM 5812 / JCM 6584 / H10) TaxID=394503 RepID=B8I3N0_RUMCH|nr:chemotaxis protein CheA [Ruminiclostridium cellulolyticum]ACL76373.1 CheA signal transduction histidine kinase [Ruminiclostridium cellulolyticum H10]